MVPANEVAQEKEFRVDVTGPEAAKALVSEATQECETRVGVCSWTIGKGSNPTRVPVTHVGVIETRGSPCWWEQEDRVSRASVNQ